VRSRSAAAARSSASARRPLMTTRWPASSSRSALA
jgi:hypothetical protein